MVVVVTVSVIVAVVVVVKVLVWVTAIINILVELEVLVSGVLVDAECIVVAVIVIVLEFALTVSYSVDVASDVDVDFGVMLRVFSWIGIEVLADVNKNAFAVVTALDFPVRTPLEEFSTCAAFDCRPLALLDCASVSQVWMPSYHV